MRPKKRVLLVEWDEGAAAVRRFLLTTRGYAVTTVMSSAAAIECFWPERFDIAVIELAMPEMDGNELTCRLKKIEGCGPIILVNDLVRPGERAHAADCFLGRGSKPAELLERVQVMCARKRGPKRPSNLDPLLGGPAKQARSVDVGDPLTPAALEELAVTA